MGFFVGFLTIFAWKHKNILGLAVLPYKGIQRIHVKETPRLGGVIIILALWLYTLLTPLLESKTILQLSEVLAQKFHGALEDYQSDVLEWVEDTHQKGLLIIMDDNTDVAINT